MTIILIVDDSTLNLRVLEHILQRADYTVLSAETGQEALDVSQGMTLDIAIIDIDMPEMTGFELLGYLRQRNPQLPVIMLTASVLNEDRQRATDLGVDAFLTKPSNSAEILETISRVLGQ